VQLFSDALPNFRCPICQNDGFVVLRDFKADAAPDTVFYARGNGHSTAFMPTLTLNCDDCGYVLPFAEEELRKRAERRK
jgi:hypothetical protein